MIGMDKVIFLLRGLREMVAVDRDAGLAIADLACRIGERFVARQRGERDLPPVTAFCPRCHRREMEELDRKYVAEAERARKGKSKQRARR